MLFGHRAQALTLFLGDLACFFLALWLTLVLRYWTWPDFPLFRIHFEPFSAIFVLWLGVYFISDFYRHQGVLFQKALPERLFRVQLINSVLAALFFYLLPYFSITPKTVLLIYLFISFFLVWLWRGVFAPLLAPRRTVRLAFACAGPEVEELKQELAKDKRFLITDFGSGNPSQETGDSIIVVVNLYDKNVGEKMTDLYRLLFQHIAFISVQDLYEQIFDRVPLALISEAWLIENISNHPKPLYSFFKRLLDIVVAGALGLISLVVYPFVWLALKIQDGGPLFITQERVGEGGRTVSLLKFRSMNRDDKGLYHEDKTNSVTKVGAWLRKMRIDELPQLWSVINGGQSLIGPRPELPALVEQYRQTIPHYEIRLLIKPGLSGWAQMYQELHPHHALANASTREKLSYDLYYLKNRNIWLDLKIALKTVALLLSFKGI